MFVESSEELRLKVIIYLLWRAKFGKATATAQAVKYRVGFELRLLSEKYRYYAVVSITLSQLSGKKQALRKCKRNSRFLRK